MPTENKSVAELRQERKDLIDSRGPLVQSMVDMRNKAKEDGNAFTAEDQEKWDKMSDDVTSLDTEERNLNTLIKLQEIQPEPDNLPAELRGAALPGRGDMTADGIIAGEQDPEKQAELRAKAEMQQFNAWALTGHRGSELRGGIGYEEALKHVSPELRGQNTLTPAAGEVLAPEEWSNKLVEGMKAFGGILSISDVVTTSNGNPLHVPTHNGTAEEGRIVGQEQPHADQDTAFGEVILNSFMYTSDVVKMSKQLEQDNAYGLVGRLSGYLSQRLGRVTSRHLGVGAGGATEPEGIFTAATSTETSIAPNAIGHLDMINLKHSVDPLYRSRGNWVWNDTTLKSLKSMLDSTGLPLWQPNVAGAEANTYDGDPYVIDQSSPNIASGLKAVLYGDFSYYMVRRVGGITLFRFNELFMTNYQIGFDAFMRMDARYVDAGGGAVKALTIA